MDFERFYNNLLNFGSIGKTEESGINRLAFSKEYYEAIDKMEEYAKNAGLKTRIDRVGNLFFEYNPNNSDKYLLVGSHMDTVKSGGLYDGALGAIGALEIVETLKEKHEDINFGIAGVAFSAEEGSEMGGTFGSRTIAGRNDLEDESLKEKLKKYNLTIEDLKDSIIDFKRVLGFLELHIEQGGKLENEDVNIGVVDGIVGITRYNILVKGEANHAGTTPMNLRKDPIKKLGKLIEKLYDEASKYESPFVMTIGDIKVRPGMYNIIPGEAELFIEVRDMEQKNIDTFFENIKNFLDEDIKDFELIKNVEKPSVKLNGNVMALAEKKCKNLGYSYKVMSSGAGHDAKEISHLVPTGMIFVPSKKGISHSPFEFTSREDLERGLNVIYEMALEILRGDGI